MARGILAREQLKLSFQGQEQNQEVLNSSKAGTEPKPVSSNFGKQEPKPKPIYHKLQAKILRANQVF